MTKDYDRNADADIVRRMEGGLRRALNTPHKPNKDFVGKKIKAAKKPARKAKKTA